MGNQAADAAKPSLVTRLREELLKYILVSGYLFTSFSVLLLYEATVTGGAHETLPFTLALIKALVLGKFLLIGEALHTGSRANNHPLLARVAWKTLAFLIVLLVFKAVEELVVGLFQNKTVVEVTGEVIARSWLENLAPILIMLLILIPLISVSESYRQLGPDQFKALWLARSDRGNESPPVCRRLHILSGWSYEQIKKVFPGVPGTGGPHVAGSQIGV